MAKKMSGKGVKGQKFVAADEAYDKKTAKKEMKSMKTAGVATAMKKAKKDEGYSKKPKVKAQKKMNKLDLKRGQVY